MATDTYLDNITSQHRDKPKFISWLSATLNKTDDIYECIKSFDDAFDLDKAVGNQQDILGQPIGSNRVLDIQPDNISPVLDDETYRLVQKAKIAQNNWQGTIPEMHTIWKNMFTDLGLDIIDNQDMSMTAVITGVLDELRELLIANGYIVPKPSGVRLNYIGKSSIQFKSYSSMVVSSSMTTTINMIQPPIIPINMTVYSSMVVSSSVTNII